MIIINENNRQSIGKYSEYASSVYRFLTILLILIPMAMSTAGLAGILAIVFYKLILKLVPFKISLYRDVINYEQGKINLDDLYRKFTKKTDYTVFLLAFIIITNSLLIISSQYADKIFFSILFSVLILILIPQILYLLYISKTIINKYRPAMSPKKSSTKPFSLYNFYFESEESSKDNNKKLGNPKFYEIMKNKSSHIKIPILQKDEIIIISLIIGCLAALFFGYQFGNTIYTKYNGQKVSDSTDGYALKEFYFNYVLSIVSFVVAGGITYIFLKRRV